MSKRGIELGTAGEHLVCADLLLAGHRAFLVAAGLPYDVIADVDGRLYRVAVKSTELAVPRPGRPLSKRRYGFRVLRSKRLASGKCQTSPYSAAECDLVALVGLDIRRVAYFAIAHCPKMVWLEAETEQPRNGFGRAGGEIRRFEDLTLASALT